jgi:hypothetical protein
LAWAVRLCSGPPDFSSTMGLAVILLSLVYRHHAFRRTNVLSSF